jgi:hypothetical protein
MGTMSSPISLDFSDHENDGDAQIQEGDYSSRMEELMGDDDDGTQPEHAESDDEEGFFYDGVDAENDGAGYRDRLKDVLGEDNDELEIHEVETSLIIEHPDHNDDFDDDEPLVCCLTFVCVPRLTVCRSVMVCFQTLRPLHPPFLWLPHQELTHR